MAESHGIEQTTAEGTSGGFPWRHTPTVKVKCLKPAISPNVIMWHVILVASGMRGAETTLQPVGTVRSQESVFCGFKFRRVSKTLWLDPCGLGQHQRSVRTDSWIEGHGSFTVDNTGLHSLSSPKWTADPSWSKLQLLRAHCWRKSLIWNSWKRCHTQKTTIRCTSPVLILRQCILPIAVSATQEWTCLRRGWRCLGRTKGRAWRIGSRKSEGTTEARHQSNLDTTDISHCFNTHTIHMPGQENHYRLYTTAISHWKTHILVYTLEQVRI